MQIQSQAGNPAQAGRPALTPPAPLSRARERGEWDRPSRGEPLARPPDAPARSPAPAEGLPSVSVVIPTYRRPELLRRCLDALIQQTYPSDRLEIVVVEDGGPGEAEAVVEQVRGRGAAVAFRYLAVPHGGPGAARNAGLKQARGDVLAFTDDDTIPDPQWIASGTRVIQAGADAASGRTIVPLSERPTDAERNTQGLERATFPTCNVFCRKVWLERLGGFDTRFRRAYREDSDLEFRLLDAGARIDHADDAIVVHPPRPERPFVSLRQQQNQVYDALLYRKHPRRFHETIRAFPPVAYYAIAAGQVGGPLALLLGRRRLAASLTAVWLLLAGRFFAQRVRGKRRDAGHLLELAITSALIPPVAVYWRLRGAWTFRVPFL